MRTNGTTSRTLLAVLGGAAGYVGLWAAFAPASFYHRFPGALGPWISVDGPYNEHLVRDIGGLYLALLVVTTVAAVRADRGAVRATEAAWLAFGLPHLAHHLRHLGDLSSTDAMLNTTVLGALFVIPTTLCLPRLKAERATRVGSALVRDNGNQSSVSTCG